jgi:thymidylate kinase
VEGLNCSGKSTYIQKKFGCVIHTPHLNPLRDINGDFALFGRDVSPYLLGAYTQLHDMMDRDMIASGKDLWLDRTFLSAFVYGSIGRETFWRLVDRLNKDKNCFIYMDTPVELCVERFYALPQGFKDYVLHQGDRDQLTTYWEYLHKNFYNYLNIISQKGFTVKWEGKGRENENIF